MASHRLTPEDSKSTHQQPPRIRRSRYILTYSTSSSLSSMSSLSFYSSSSPSPFHTPFHPSSSAIPFSWERTPGIPKTPLNQTLNSCHVPHLLPPPPPPPPPSLRSNSSKLADVDPFAAAIAECAKDPPPGEVKLWENRPETAAIGGVGRRRSIGEWIRLGFLDLYGSCKSSCSVSEPTMETPRASSGLGRTGY